MLNNQSHKSPFEGKVRVRACGILQEEGRILLLKHTGIGSKGYQWSPPGGGVEFGAHLEQTLVREFEEETKLKICVDRFLFSNEHIDKRHHALEFFFQVRRISGELQVGFDPELPHEEQMISEARFFHPLELKTLDPATIHRAFLSTNERVQITDLRGLISFDH